VASIQRREVERVAVVKATGEKRQVRAVVYRARYRDEGGKEHAGHFQRKVDAQRWLDVSGLGMTSPPPAWWSCPSSASPKTPRRGPRLRRHRR